MVDEIVVVPQEDEARLNVTWAGNNFDLPDPIFWNMEDREIRSIAEEVIRNGALGVVADRDVDLTDFVIDRFPVNDQRPYRLYQIRPKTPFGS